MAPTLFLEISGGGMLALAWCAFGYTERLARLLESIAISLFIAAVWLEIASWAGLT